MKIQLESTDEIVTLSENGHTMQARIWVGATEDGIGAMAYITRIGFAEAQIPADFDPGLMPHIATLSAYLAVGKDGDEGVCGFMGTQGWMPMVCADEKRAESLRPIAQQIANQTGATIRFVRFSERQDVEVIRPDEPTI